MTTKYKEEETGAILYLENQGSHWLLKAPLVGLVVPVAVALSMVTPEDAARKAQTHMKQHVKALALSLGVIGPYKPRGPASDGVGDPGTMYDPGQNRYYILAISSNLGMGADGPVDFLELDIMPATARDIMVWLKTKGANPELDKAMSFLEHARPGDAWGVGRMLLVFATGTWFDDGDFHQAVTAAHLASCLGAYGPQIIRAINGPGLEDLTTLGNVGPVMGKDGKPTDAGYEVFDEPKGSGDLGEYLDAPNDDELNWLL